MLSLRINAFFGLLGFLIPTFVLFVSYPILIHHLGTEPFGIFLLATSISGALAFADLGMSSATTKFVAEEMGKGNAKKIGEILIASLFFYGLLGLTLALGTLATSAWLCDVFSISPANAAEGQTAFRLAGVQFFLLMLINVFVALFKGIQRFDKSTVISSVLTTLTYGMPAAASYITKVDLVDVIWLSLTAHAVTLCLCLLTCMSLLAEKTIAIRYKFPNLALYRRMITFGLPMTINSVCGLLLYQIQQFLVASLAGPAAVSIYRVATTIPSKAHAAINSATEVLFPFSSSTQNITQLRTVYIRMLCGSAVVALALLLPIGVFATPILELWIGGTEFSESATIMPLFCAAYFFLCLSPAPFHLLNGIGKPWINTMFYASNAAINVLLIYLMRGVLPPLLVFSVAFLIANFVTCVAYQLYVERKIWRQLRQLPPAHGKAR